MPGDNLGKRLRLHHVGIVAPRKAQIEEFQHVLGLETGARGTLEKYDVTNMFLKCGAGPSLHFMLPHKGVLKNFNQGRGGLHHIAFCVQDIAAVQEELKQRGLRFLAAEPQNGLGEYKFNFVLPNIAGVNVELIQDPEFDWPE